MSRRGLGWMLGDGWVGGKSTSDRESLFDAAPVPGRRLLVVLTVFLSPSSGGSYLNCVVLDLHVTYSHTEWKRGAELRTGNLINPEVNICYFTKSVAFSGVAQCRSVKDSRVLCFCLVGCCCFCLFLCFMEKHKRAQKGHL